MSTLLASTFLLQSQHVGREGLQSCKVLRVQFIAEGEGERGRGTLGPERTASNLLLISKHLSELPLARLDSMNGLSIVLSNAF